MPRKAQRAQKVRAPQDQAYGQSGEQMAAQHQVPIPDMRGTSAPSSPASGPSGGGAGVPPGNGVAVPQQLPPNPYEIAAGIPAGPPSLGAPTQRPFEPLTAGLATGPGPGPEILPGNGDRVATVYEKLAAATGDPRIAELAARARVSR